MALDRDGNKIKIGQYVTIIKSMKPHGFPRTGRVVGIDGEYISIQLESWIEKITVERYSNEITVFEDE